MRFSFPRGTSVEGPSRLCKELLPATRVVNELLWRCLLWESLYARLREFKSYSPFARDAPAAGFRCIELPTLGSFQSLIGEILARTRRVELRFRYIACRVNVHENTYPHSAVDRAAGFVGNLG